MSVRKAWIDFAVQSKADPWDWDQSSVQSTEVSSNHLQGFSELTLNPGAPIQDTDTDMLYKDEGMFRAEVYINTSGPQQTSGECK